MISLIAMGTLSINAYALVGNVSEVQASADGTIKVKVTDGTTTQIKQIVGTADAIKAMYAAALTAKTSTSTVYAQPGTYDTLDGWILFSIR